MLRNTLIAGQEQITRWGAAHYAVAIATVGCLVLGAALGVETWV